MGSADDAVARCLEYMQRQWYAEAGDLAEAALEQYPEHGMLWQLRGMACWFQGEHEATRWALETAVFFGPLQPMAQIALAGAYARTDAPVAAREIYRRLLQDDRTPSALLPRVAVGLGMLNEHWLALQVCRRLARLVSTHHGAFFGMAYYMAQMDYPPECFLRHLLRAHELAPERLPYRINLAMALAELGQDDRAYDLVKDVPPERVSCVCWLRRLADVCAGAGDTARSQAYLSRLTMLAPE